MVPVEVDLIVKGGEQSAEVIGEVKSGLLILMKYRLLTKREQGRILKRLIRKIRESITIEQFPM